MDTEHEEVDTEGKEAFIDEEDPATLLDLKYLEELSEEDRDDLAARADDAEKRSFVKIARTFKQRRDLAKLDCFHQQKEHDMLKTREKLKLCHENIDGLVQQRDHLEKEIEQYKSRDNSVAVFRLRAQHKRLSQELQSEEELETQINTKLKQQQMELWKVEVDLGRRSSIRQEVEEEEHLFQVAKAERAATRLQQEQKASQNQRLKMQQLRKKQAATLEKAEAEYQKKINEVQVNRNKAAKYLKETLTRVHRQKAEEEQKNRESIQKKIQAMQSLTSNIAATQESIRAQQSKAKTNAQKKEQQLSSLRQSLQAQGINSITHVYQQKQQEELNRKKEEFKERQKSKKVEIVAKILQEKQLLKRRNRHEAPLPKHAFTDRAPFLEKTREKLLYSPEPTPPPATDSKVTLAIREYSSASSTSSVTSDLEDLEEVVQQEVEFQGFGDSLAEPEFSGLWDQNSKKLQNVKSKFLPSEEKQEEAVMTSGKLNTSAKKFCGKELKGPPFISKPEVILFKDFETGKIYKKKIVLTNISYITNSCKLLGLSAQLVDFILINFEPPGPLSAGMSCELQAVFHPKINKDLEGEVQFDSTVGPFSVPIRCTTKKCDLEVDCQVIDFGSHVVGQTISRTITLTNKGALPTLFSVDTSGCLSPEAVQMPSLISTNTIQDASRQNLTSSSQKGSSSMAVGEVQPEQVGQEQSAALPQEQSDSTEPETACNADVSSVVDGWSTAVFSDISFGSVREGEIRPFESIKLEIVFTPTTPGQTKLDFHIRFSDLTSKPIPIHVRGVAVSVPVWIVQANIDLKICMFDRFYQDNVIVQSSANTVLKLTFEVCPEMRNHMEIRPKTGFIQAKSSFNAQLKFLPRSSLSEDAEMFFDSDTGVLEVPVMMQVAGQVQPVHFTVHAVVTSSDLQFDQTLVDFGFCPVSQSVKTSVGLTNLSLLPQDFGFLGLPQFIDVQPNDGFGTLLPQETLKIDLIFSPHQAKRYCFQITCKSGVNREFHLSCRGVGVRPPLDLSHSIIQFGATALGDHSTALLYLTNHHTDRKLSKQPVPLGKNEARLKSYPGCSLLPYQRIQTSVSLLRQDACCLDRCLVQVTFSPRVSELEIKEEALRLLHRAKSLSEELLERSRHTEQEKVPEKPNKEEKTVHPKDIQMTDGIFSPEDIHPGSEQYEAGRTSLLYSFTQRYRQHTVPCFVSDGDPSVDDLEAQPAWSAYNTLYLKLHCPVVQPPLVVISNNGQNIIDFHQVAVGEKVIKRFTVQNISKESLDLRSSLLDIDGPFSLLSALRCVRPGEQHTLRLVFTPTLGKKYVEYLQLHSQTMSLEMTLCGEGVVPTVTSSHPGGVLDFSFVMVKETSSQVLKLQNSSVVPVGFRVLLASLSPSGPERGADTLLFIQGTYTDAHTQPTVGTQNYNGLSVFSVVPAEGSIAPGQSQDVTVTFQPDHPSVNYSDRLTVELTNKSVVSVVDVKGAASSQNMYLCGGDRLMVPVESLLPPLITSETQLTDLKDTSSTPVLLMLRAGYSSGSIIPAVRELQVGCINSMQPTLKGGEFHWGDVESLQQHGFRVEPTKGTVGVGLRCTITITWTPQAGYKPNEIVQMCVPLTLMGDKTNVYSISLQGFLSTR